MVDLDDLDDDSGKSSSSSSSSGSKKEKRSKGSSSSSGGAEPHTLDKDEMMDPSDGTMGKTAKNWATEKSDLNYDSGSGGSFSQYASKQVEETRELHDNIHDMLGDHMDNFDEFTIYFHALFFNLATNRAGIANVIEENFGVSRNEAVQRADKICKKAGEDELFNKVMKEMTENLVGE